MEEIILIESPSLREKLCTEQHTSVLERVGNLVTLPRAGFATTEQVAQFYEVTIEVIRQLVSRHRDELDKDGYRVLSSKEFKNLYPEIGITRARYIAIFPRRAILRVGMLLAESNIAKLVRHYLLTMEEYGLGTVDRRNLLHVAEQLHEHAEKIALNTQTASQNTAQLVQQADLLKDIIREVYRGRDEIQEIRQELRQLKLRHFEAPCTPKEQSYISDQQIEILKQKVRELPDKPITVWKRFNKFFNITRYRFLPEAQFKQALNWLNAYQKK